MNPVQNTLHYNGANKSESEREYKRQKIVETYCGG